jgi:hypothetical protein
MQCYARNIIPISGGAERLPLGGYLMRQARCGAWNRTCPLGASSSANGLLEGAFFLASSCWQVDVAPWLSGWGVGVCSAILLGCRAQCSAARAFPPFFAFWSCSLPWSDISAGIGGVERNGAGRGALSRPRSGPFALNGVLQRNPPSHQLSYDSSSYPGNENVNPTADKPVISGT